jgi:serine protease Do
LWVSPLGHRFAGIAALALMLLGVRTSAQTPAASPATSVSAESLGELSDALEGLAAKAASSVVRVFTVRYGAADRPGQSASDLISKQRGSGSGVVVDPEGYIVTNAHVVAGARRIQVLLPRPPAGTPEGKSILSRPGELVGAQLVGIDRETDLAVLRVKAPGLSHLELGDSDEVTQGQMVLALGSPFGLHNSVTLGVVSSVARQLREEDPVVYIQTDAPINPGNSGGPLINTRGKVVGINSGIASLSGGNEGIGFALPSNIVRNVFEQIRTSGRVRRGEIAVNAQTITPELAASLGLPQTWGVILSDVFPGGPADQGGLRPGDVILSLDGKPMENGRQLEINLYRRRAGEKVTLEVQRGGERRSLVVQVVDRKAEAERFTDLVTPENLVAPLGILGIDVNAEIGRLIPGLRRQSGVLVASIAADTPFWEGGFEPGDVIHALNGADVTGVGSLRTKLAQFHPGDPVALHIERRGQYRYLVLILE